MTDNYIICVHSGSVSVGQFFFSLCVVFSSFFTCLVVFYWIPDFVNFTFLGVECSCIPVNIHGFCPEMLSYLETAWSFWVLLLRFTRWKQRHVYIRADYFPLLRQDPSECVLYLVLHELWCFPVWLVGKGTNFPPTQWSQLSLILSVILPPALGCFLICMHWPVLCWELEGAPLQISGVESLDSFLQCPAPWTLATVSWSLRQFSSTQGVPQAPHGLPVPAGNYF